MTNILTFQLARFHTPLGIVQVATDDRQRLRAIDWARCTGHMEPLLDRQYGKGAARLVDALAVGPVFDRLGAYFDGDVTAIAGLATATAGTAFQREVWAALCEIAAGETWSYRQLAAHIGRPNAVRAVGLAIGSNPINLVVPCHRVIGADGGLTGYTGGLNRKQWLLEHEGAISREAILARPVAS